MIPLGLKETKEIDFREPFKDFVLEHYSEDGHDYENAIAGEGDNQDLILDFICTRKASCFCSFIPAARPWLARKADNQGCIGS